MDGLNSGTILLSIAALVIKYKRSDFKSKNLVRKRLLNLLKLFFEMEKLDRIKSRKTVWVRDILSESERLLQGASNNLVKDMYENDEESFFNYFRMPRMLYDELLTMVGPKIKKQDFVRQSISPEVRLQLTLRYLTSGDSMASMHYTFRVGTTTVSEIISETCSVLWDSLKEKVFVNPSRENWRKVAEDFDKQWNFINCIGALDGKHVVIQALPNSGSKNYNYKGTHSINLMAIADANYKFLMVDIGGEGRQSDSTIFKSSAMGQGFENSLFDLPPPKNGLPFVLVADEAFPLTNYIMRPYPRRGNLDLPKKVFNYRLSRARRVVENTFGIFSARWRIFRKPIIASNTTVKKIVQASVCLHNFVQNYCNARLPLNMDDLSSTPAGLQNMTRSGTNTFSRNVANVRDDFKNYFCGNGAVEWQWQKAQQNDF